MTADDQDTRVSEDTGVAAFEAARWSLTEQFRAIESSDAKTERLLGAGFVVVGLYGTAVTLIVERGRESTANVALVVAIAVVVTFVVTASLFLRGNRIRKWDAGPLGEAMLDFAGANPEPLVRIWLAEQFVLAFQENEGPLGEKAKWYRRSEKAFMAEIIIAVLGIGIVAAVELAVRNYS